MNQIKKSKERIKKILTCIILVLLAGSFWGVNNIIMNSEKINKANNFNTNSQITTVEIAEDGAIICDSIVQGVRDCNLVDGNYIFRVTGNLDGTEEIIDYPVELINYYDDVTYSLDEGETEKTVSLGDTTTEYKMLVVKYHKDLTIDDGVTLTATAVEKLTYKKGMYLCVLGELTNNGTITMTARGTYNCEGENVYLWKNKDLSFEYVPAVGGSGAPSKSYNALNKSANVPGVAGSNGNKRSTGGGGSGGLWLYRSKVFNATGGATGTSYSGGSGGGGVYRWSNSNTTYANDAFIASNANPNGGQGGSGLAYQTDHTNKYANGGGSGAGNPVVDNQLTGINQPMDLNKPAENGTGGLLIIYSQDLYNNGVISSNGSNGGSVKGNGDCSAAGAGSGGGSINIFAATLSNTNTHTIEALGGEKGVANVCNRR